MCGAAGHSLRGRDAHDHTRASWDRSDPPGEQVELTQPTIRGDTIVAGPIAIPRSDVERMEARRFSPVRTLLVIAAIPLIVPTLFFLGMALCDSEETNCGDFSGSGY